MQKQTLSNFPKIVLFTALIFSLSFFHSCKSDDESNEPESCTLPMDAFLTINGEQYNVDYENEELIFRCEYVFDAEGIIISIDELKDTVGGVIIDDYFSILLKQGQLEEGVFQLKRNEASYCANGDYNLMEGEAISSIQLNNCCNFRNADATIEIIECDGSFVIIGDNINYSEYSCEVEQGGDFTASFQLICQ
jgi:hypothetical protein